MSTLFAHIKIEFVYVSKDTERESAAVANSISCDNVKRLWSCWEQYALLCDYNLS